jgi:serine/threonine protein phosphatase PrpC
VSHAEPILAEGFLCRCETGLVSSIGAREVQEDAVTEHFVHGTGVGYVVLADGMGGHAAGDVASRIVVREFSAELTHHTPDPLALESNIGRVLNHALLRANGQLARQAASQPGRKGMGSTLLALLILQNRLYWISVGDSPLFLLRGKRMSRLNQEHSLARHLDRLVTEGVMSRDEADLNPDRNCLTSVLAGTDVPEIDCRDRPIDLYDGDILIAASDGILSLGEQKIAACLYGARETPGAEIGASLLREIEEAGDPDQDNVTLCVIKVSMVAEEPRPVLASTSPSELPDETLIAPAPHAHVLPTPAHRVLSNRRSRTDIHLSRRGGILTGSVTTSPDAAE